VTDGVLGSPEAALFDSLLSQFRHSTIECSFIHAGRGAEGLGGGLCGGLGGGGGLGRVPFPQLMQFVAMATFGAYINRLPDIVSYSPRQQSITSYGSQRIIRQKSSTYQPFKYEPLSLF
jgi:hypothetical protein